MRMRFLKQARSWMSITEQSDVPPLTKGGQEGLRQSGGYRNTSDQAVEYQVTQGTLTCGRPYARSADGVTGACSGR